MNPPHRTPGRIVWHVLRTPALDDSAAFYEQLFGWVADPEEPGPWGPFRRLRSDGTPVAALCHGDDEAWLPFANTPDLSETSERARGAGGGVEDRVELPGLGQAVVLRDRGGARIAAWCATVEEGRDSGRGRPLGTICWNELHASKARASARFYATVFGLRPAPLRNDDPEFYTFLERGPRRCDAAVRRRTDGARADCWAPKIRVRSADAMAATAEGLGAVLLEGPTTTPGGREAHLRDPLGNRFGVVA